MSGDGRWRYHPKVDTGGVTSVQDIRFARSADGTAIAYAVHGSGPPLLIDACWLSHLQNVYAKLDLHGRSARMAAVARLLSRV